jgi:hypothetical protein
MSASPQVRARGLTAITLYGKVAHGVTAITLYGMARCCMGWLDAAERMTGADDVAKAAALPMLLWERFGTWVPAFPWQGHTYVRVSAQIYLELSVRNI